MYLVILPLGCLSGVLFGWFILFSVAFIQSVWPEPIFPNPFDVGEDIAERFLR